MSIFSMNALMEGLMKGAEPALQKVREGIDAFGEKLRAQKEIRIFVDGAINLGHQASSVHVMRRLIERFKYSGRITVAYKPSTDSEDTMTTPQKLALLIPDLDPQKMNDVRIGPCVVSFVKYADMKGADPVTFGFTGGADDEENFAAGMQVELFLRLQPYLWDHPDQIQFLSPERAPINLAGEDTLGTLFGSRAYFYDRPSVLDKTWDWYARNGPAEQQERVKLARIICGAVQERSIHLWPAYSIRVGGGQTGAPPEAIVLKIIASTLISQNDYPGPAVLVIFEDLPASVRKIVRLLVDGGGTKVEIDTNKEFQELQRILDKIDPFGPGSDHPDFQKYLRNLVARMDLLRAVAENYEKRRSFLRLASARERVRVVTEDLTQPVLAEALKFLEDDERDRRVLVLSLGRVPALIFQDMFALAGLPSVFEGQTTAGFVLNLGTAYLHMPNVRAATEERYPSTLLGPDYSDVALACNSAANQMVRRLDGTRPSIADRFKEGFRASSEEVARFIRDSWTDPSSDLARYFQRIRAFYREETNDKLLLGIVWLNYVVEMGADVLVVRTRSSDLAGVVWSGS